MNVYGIMMHGGGMMIQRGRGDMVMHDDGDPQGMMKGGPRMGKPLP
jgi:hypothetical protein